jgi:ankyrin repeat protein
LVKSGADVNAKAAIASRWGGSDGIDAMKIAVNLKQRDMVTLLLEYGAEASAADEDGNLAVHEAAAIGDLALLQAILGDDPRRKAKETITARNKSGHTPLVLAVRSHRLDAVDYLVKRSKELYGSDFLEYWGNGAVDEALTLRFVRSIDQSEIDDARRKAGEILVFLLEGGADRTFKDGRGRTILMRTIQAGFDVKVIQAVVSKQSQLDAVDRDGKDAYSFAQGRTDAVEIKELLDGSR